MRNTHRWSMMQRVNGTSLLLFQHSHWLPSQLPRNCNWYGTNALRQQQQQLTGLADHRRAGYCTTATAGGGKWGYILASHDNCCCPLRLHFQQCHYSTAIAPHINHTHIFPPNWVPPLSLSLSRLLDASLVANVLKYTLFRAHWPLPPLPGL